MTVFDPVAYSDVENQFLLVHLGESPAVALSGAPKEINPRAVRPILEKVYELEDLQKHRGAEWCGLEEVKEKITAYLAESAKWRADQRIGAPRFPPMFSYDAKGRPHRGGTGSDSGKVSTFFSKAGERVPFAVDLIPSGRSQWRPEWAQADAPTKGITDNADKGRLECDICGHTEKYNPDSRASHTAARARLRKHLASSTKETELHRELLTLGG